MNHTSCHSLPYEGLRVIEFTHMVMGPTCGMPVSYTHLTLPTIYSV